MKKILILVIGFTILTFLAGCNNILGGSNTDTSDGGQSNNGDSDAGKKIEMNLYFPNKDNSKVLIEKREVIVKDGAIIRAAVEALIEGPQSEELRKPMPEGTKILSVSKEGNVAVVDFSEEYVMVNDLAEVVERVSVVNTLTEIEGIEKVRILVGGMALIGPSGEPFGDLARIPLDSQGQPQNDNVKQDQIKTVTVYFSDSKAELVAPEKRVVEVKQGDSIEKVIFNEMKKGPKTNELDPVIPEGTKLLSVKTENGVCTLNLSEEFISNHIGGSTGELMTINSIVSSLTELPDISKVQFLIEGKVREVFIHSALDTPIERDESIIKK